MSELNFAKTFLQSLDAKSTKYSSNYVFDPETFATRIPFTVPKLPQPPHPPYPKTTPTAPPAPGATRTQPTISLTLKSSRNPNLTLTLSNLNPSTTTISRLRETIQSELGGPSIVTTEKIKILFNRKPISASKKTISDVLEGESAQGGKTVEMGVMIMGGAPDPPVKTGLAPATVASPSPSPASLDTPEQKQPAPEEPNKTKEPPAPPPEKMEGIETTTTVSSPPPVQGPSGKAIIETDDFWTDLHGYLQQRIKDEAEAMRLVKKWRSGWKS